MAKKRKGEEPDPEMAAFIDETVGDRGKAIAEGVDDSAQQLAEEQAMLGRMTPLERARFAFGLEEEHVLKAAEYPQPDGSVRVVLLTQGGQRLRWPEDEGRVLKQHEKDGTVPGAPPGGIFPVKR